MRTYLITFALSLIIALLLTPWIRNWAHRKKLIDEPGERKIHKSAIPRLGGVAILIALTIPLASLLVLNLSGFLDVLDTDSADRISTALWSDAVGRDKDIFSFWPAPSLVKSLVFGLSVIAIVGIWDDLYGVRARYKLLAQIGAAMLVFFSGIQIEAISIPFASVVHFPPWVSLGVTVFWVVLVINAINLIDGMDGLAGSVVALAGSSLFVMSLFEQNPLACLLLAALVGATLGFLAYNIHPASIFLGDTGSMSLGFVLSVISVHSSQKSYALFSMLGAMFVMGLPIFDLSMAVVRRFLSGRNLFGADQHHIHHLLLRRGFSQKQSVYMLVGVAVLLEIIAFISIYADDRLAAFSILLLVPLGFIAVRFLGYHRIIGHARREKILSSTEDIARARLDAIRVFQQETPSTKESLHQAIENLIPHVGWKSCTITHNKAEWFTYPTAESERIHIEGLRENEIELDNGWMVRITQLKEEEVFSPHDNALQHFFAAILRSRLSLFTM